MKKINFVLLFLFACFFVSAQNTPKGSFFITENKQPNNLEFFEISIMKSDLESFRLKNTEVELMFENGFKLTLLSYESAIKQGIVLPMNEYPVAFPENYFLPSFSIIQGGQLIAKSKTINKETSTH